MDDRRFDALTRVLSEGQSGRRRVVKGLVGGALAGVLGRFGMGTADAQDVEASAARRCKNDRQCRRDSERCCNGRCLNILNDRRVCGGCGQRCGTGEACVNGACVRACRTGRAGVCDADDCGDLCGCNTIFNGGNGATYCLSVRGSCANARACNRNADCPTGLVCVNDGCCAGKPRVCTRPCDTRGTRTADASVSTSDASRASAR